VLRTVNDQPTLWDAILPPEPLVLPVELGRVDALLDDPVFFAPFAGYFDARIGRPSIPMETYLRLMFLKFRYRLGYESLCREVADSISWQRFCRIPFGTRVPHPTTLMKITTRCGDDAVAGLRRCWPRRPPPSCRASTGSAPIPPWWRRLCAIRPIRGCWPRRSAPWRAPWSESKAPAGPPVLGRATGAARRVDGPARSPPSRGCADSSSAIRPRPRCGGSPGSWPGSPRRDARSHRGAAQRPPCATRCQRAAQRPAAPGDQRPEHPMWGAPDALWRRPAAGWAG